MPLLVDYSFSRPRPAKIVDAGYAGVCRYLSNDVGKNLRVPERDDLLAAGLDIVLVWETTTDRVLSGADGGTEDGRRAKQQADALGVPDRAAIYFAVDFDINPGQLAAAYHYRDAFDAQLGPHPDGVYGGLVAVTALMAHGSTYGWQTAAWSHGQRAEGIHLFQRIKTCTVDGVDCDENEALEDDYGGWRAVTPPIPVPSRPPVVTAFPGDSMNHFDIHVEGVNAQNRPIGLDDQGHGSTLVDTPAGTVITAYPNTAGYVDVPLFVGAQDDGGKARIIWKGPPNYPPFDAHVWTTA